MTAPSDSVRILSSSLTNSPSALFTFSAPDMDSALMKAAYAKMAGEPRTVASIVGLSAMES